MDRNQRIGENRGEGGREIVEVRKTGTLKDFIRALDLLSDKGALGKVWAERVKAYTFYFKHSPPLIVLMRIKLGEQEWKKRD